MKKNLGYKILALVITLFIWLQISLLREQTTIINIPIRIIGISDDLYLMGVNELKVPINVHGRGINILIFYLSDPSINYNGENIILGNNIIDLGLLEQSLPINPKLRFSFVQSVINLTITTDKIVSKRVRLIYDFYSNIDKEALLANNYIFEDFFVTISGPGYQIESIEYVYTEIIKLDIIKDENPHIRVKPINEHVLTLPSVINLVKTTEMISSKTLPFIPIIHDEKVIIFPQRVTVKIEGKTDSLSLVGANDIIAYVAPDLHSDKEETEIRFRKPNFVNIIDYTPKSVSVQIK